MHMIGHLVQVNQSLPKAQVNTILDISIKHIMLMVDLMNKYWIVCSF